MNLLEILTSTEGKNREYILEIIFNDSVKFILRLIGLFIVIYLGKKIIEFLLNRLDEVPKNKLNIGARDFMKSLIKLSLYVVLFLLGLLIFGFNEHSIFTMISAIGLGIGISLKDFLSNLAGGVVILFTKPFNIGEYIEVSGAFGQVYKIDVFSTHINTLDSKRVIIPNNLMVNSLVTNYDTNEYRRTKLDISISYESDHLKAIELLNNISKTFPGLEHDRKTFINFMEYGASSVNILFMAWAKKDNYYRTRSLLIAHIIKVFNDSNIEMPYNKLDINIKGEVNNKEKC
ncbi:mechanosensitive ion channel domain-containing protein [Fusobacterium sp.]|uniref:mechanosensitive ion channel family protein n=1 Tax=Fusobacterium sp. TaxID=68766 RepID=UPI0025C46131|nr:mechanosensitive ion channel domain-containing protein [Fusobacterium sp.]